MSKENKNKNETQEKIEKLKKKINMYEKLGPISIISFMIIMGIITHQSPNNPFVIYSLFLVAPVACAGGACVLVSRRNQMVDIFNKFILQEEYEKLKDEDKEMVKEITKEKEIVKSDFNIDLNTNLTKEQQDLLLSASLNKDVKKYLNVVRNSLTKSEICDYDFDKEKLDKQYNEVMSSKKLVKRKNK